MAAAHKNVGVVLQRHGYSELKKIGEGSFGKAILVQSRDGNKVVCKMVDISKASAKEANAAMKEAQVLSTLKHPYIVRYRENFTEAGWFCILMDYCEGGDLTKQIDAAKKGRRPISEDQALRWFTQALLAIKYIHDKHILHRDLKPANFFLSKTRSLKMGDFGIAKVLASTMACAKTQIGTPYYLSPEVCQEKPYSWASDVWAMGCILYELIVHKVPFDAPNMHGLVQKIVKGTAPTLPSSSSPHVKEMVAQMLHRAQANRPSVADLLKRPSIQTIVKTMLEEAQQHEPKDGGGDVEAALLQQQQPNSARQPAAPPAGANALKVGDLVDYYSTTHSRWVPATIIKVDGASGSVVIDLKPKNWIPKEEQTTKLRPRTVAAAASPAAVAAVATPMRQRTPSAAASPQQPTPASAVQRSGSADTPRAPPKQPALPARCPSAEAIDRQRGMASPMRMRSPSVDTPRGRERVSSTPVSRGASPHPSPDASPGVYDTPRMRPPGIPRAADHSPLRRRNMAASQVGGSIAGA